MGWDRELRTGSNWDVALAYLLEAELEGEWLATPLKVTVQTRGILLEDVLTAQLPLRHGSADAHVEPLSAESGDLTKVAQELMSSGQLRRYITRYPNYDDMVGLAEAFAETPVPIFASPPSSWKTIGELLASNGAASAALVTGAVNSPVGYLAVLASAAVYIEVGMPVLRSVGRNLSDVIDLHFEERRLAHRAAEDDPKQPGD